MSDRRLYINDGLHTGHIRESSLELLHYGLRAVEAYRDRVEAINPASTPLTEPILVGLAFNPSGLS